MATATLFSSFIPSSSAFFIEHQQQSLQPMSSLLFFFLFLLSLCFLFVALYKRLKRTGVEDEKLSRNALSCSLSDSISKTHQPHEAFQNPLTHPLLVEILALDPPKWESLASSIHFHLSGKNNGEVGDNQVSNGSEVDKESVDSVGEDCVRSDEKRGKKKKKRGKKKRQNYRAQDVGEDGCLENQELGAQDKQDLVCFYPFTSSSSATQRKIKQQYDHLVKFHDAKALTLAQVGQFVNCLIEARNDLQHKSEVIQRKFTITKALLFKADRSSFDRLCQQIYKLEAEQKRLEEDAIVYNWLQQQLKLSPTYKKMLEIGASMELKAKSSQLGESTDTEYPDISFEELLAQEKKDSFWQRNGKLRSCTS